MGKLLVKCQPQGLRNKMPVVSKKQEKFMQAVANNPKFAKKVGVKQSIGREFTKEKDMKKAVKKMNMGGMADREGRAMASGKFKDMPGKMKDARGRAMKKGGAVMKAKGKKMMGGGKVKAYKKGGSVSSASKRADGIAQRGHTRGRHV